jgi:methionyl-tRNA formyltransferase
MAEPIRVLFITQDDPLFVRRFFQVFLAEYPREDIEVAGITVGTAFNEARIALIRRLLGAYGVLEFLRLLRRFAGAKLRTPSIAALARRQSIPLLETLSVNDAAYVDMVRRLDIDVIASVAAAEIFEEPLLMAPPRGCVNLHSGKLPQYRGMMPSFWQMVRGEADATVTVHRMATRVDAGDVLATQHHPIRPGDSLARVMTLNKVAGARLMIRVLCQLARRPVEGEPLDMAQASYYSFPKRDDIRQLARRGHGLF